MTARRRREGAALAAAMLVALPFTGSVAQQRTQKGRSLDGNLMVGSGGYNRPARSGRNLTRQRYTPGSSRPIFVVTRSGEMRYSPHNAFAPRSAYTAVGFQGDYTTQGSLSRFRYR